MGSHCCGHAKVKKDERFVNPLRKAKGLGSAHHGVEGWKAMKLTSIANVPLVLWLVYSVAKLQGASYAEFTAWLAQPVNAVLMILMIVSTFYHAVLGAREITEDYISCPWFKSLKLTGQKLFFFALGAACIFSVLKVALAG